MHRRGPYRIKNQQLLKGNTPMDNPAILIHVDGENYFSTKVGTKLHIGRCFKRYIQAHPESMHSVNMFDFTNTLLTLDAVCTICNAVRNQCETDSLKFLMEGDIYNLNAEIMRLQMAGY